MNPKLFIADFTLLLVFILQGMETHDSESSFLEILMPYAIAIVSIILGLIKIRFIQNDGGPEYVKSLRIWIAAIVFGTIIRFIMNDTFAIMYLIVITSYSIITSGAVRLIHKQIC